MNELQGSSFTYLIVEACARCAQNWHFKVDEVANPFHAPEPMNNITSRQVNPPFIRPHSGACLRWFAWNYFGLRSMPQFAMWTAVYIPRPPSTFNCRTLPFSRFIQYRWSDSSLISNPWITCHVPCSTRRLGSKQRANLHPGVISNHRWNRLLSLRR